MKRIILCSDGTGNKGGSTPDTNVFRIFNAVTAHGPDGIRQITYYDQGVGTSSNKLLKGIGGAFGFGLNKNIRDLYEFLGRHFVPGDEIFLFGFSRGAATSRAFAGMLQACGLVNLYKNFGDSAHEKERKTEEDYQAQIDEAMDFYVRHGKQSKTSLDVAPGPALTRNWGDTYLPSDQVPIKFIGVWDTVSALGFPQDWSWIYNRIFRFLDHASDRIAPHRFYNYQLSERVENVYHALSIDDERKTFYPRVWREHKNPSSPGPFLRPQNIEQVWFPGVHSNVGGGYARDRLALVSLAWMMKKAGTHGLAFKEGRLESIEQDASAHGKYYDSRAGLGMYYRYAPRNLEALCLSSHKIRPGEIKLHESVFDRMEQVTENYAPGHLPYYFQIVPYDIKAPVTPHKAAEEKPEWNGITTEIRKYTGRRKWFYSLFAESSFLALLLAWYFWAIPPLFDFSSDGYVMKHIVKFINYLVPVFLEGLFTFFLGTHLLLGVIAIVLLAAYFRIRGNVIRKTAFYCRQARDRLIQKTPCSPEEVHWATPPGKQRKSIPKSLPGIALSLMVILFFVINLFATFQGTRIRKPGKYAGNGFTFVTAKGTPACVDARQYWNPSGLLLEKGVEYRVEIPQGQVWWDWNREATVTGWVTPEPGIFRIFARNPGTPLFQLMGAIHGSCRDGGPCVAQFPIKDGHTFIAGANGEFSTYANDWPFMYWNNKGKIDIIITRVAEAAPEIRNCCE